jgi:L,D-transpeptidase ErfK/SrfK
MRRRASTVLLFWIALGTGLSSAAADRDRGTATDTARPTVSAAPLGAPGPNVPPPVLAELVGEPSVDVVAKGDTLLDVAERHRLGFERVAHLNPGLDAWIPTPGARVRLPTYHVLPDTPHEGLVVNLPELQLYDYGVDRDRPEVLALAIGDELDPSLIGAFRIGAKRANPVWHVPASIRAEKPELPAEVPAGPDNPLGPYWLTIGSTSYGIHGTNNRWSIGREATHGCLRLYNDVVERVYRRTPTGTPVRIVYQTVKLGRRDGVVYVEAHPDRYRRDPDRRATAYARLAALGIEDEEALRLLDRAIEEARGEPIAIAVLPD